MNFARFNAEKGCYHLTDAPVRMGVSNPVVEDPSQLREGARVGDIGIDLTNVRAIYPMIEAAHADRMTLNYTVYSEKSMKGYRGKTKPFGHASFVMPSGKPIITDHNLQGAFFGIRAADVPMGRVVHASYNPWPKDKKRTPMPKPIPHTWEGAGWLGLIGMITDPVSIERVLASQFHTVSIGVDALSIIESLSGLDIVKIMKERGEMPTFERGGVYDGKLSYWTCEVWQAREVSFVNSPADELAAVRDKDVGEAKIRLLFAQKKTGEEAYTFHDACTGEKITSTDESDMAFEGMGLVDSIQVGTNLWYFSNYSATRSPEKVMKLIESIQDDTPVLEDEVENDDAIDFSTKGATPSAIEQIRQRFLEKVQTDGTDWIPGIKDDTATQKLVALLTESEHWSMKLIADAIRFLDSVESQDQTDDIDALIDEVLDN